jgi:hypothetical protein
MDMGMDMDMEMDIGMLDMGMDLRKRYLRACVALTYSK